MKVELLKLINDNNNITQRKIAEELNISLGKVNSLIKELKDNELICISTEGNKVQYELTNYGLYFLESMIKEQKEKRLNLHKGTKKDIKQAVILGAGYNKFFDRPPGFLEIENFKIIDRIVKQLRKNKIEKIVIVTGYQKEYYEAYAKQNVDIYCVNNPEYKWTGSMYSLELAKKYITDDFILIENDLIFENRLIEILINNENRDCIVLTTESGSGDEAFVEIRDGSLYKISKDIHQFNRIDGEMIGVSKISYKLFELMLKEFSNNENQYMNYEYTLLDVARNYKVGYLKINDLIWGEIDNEQQYERVKEYIYPIIKRREVNFEIEKIKRQVKLALNIEEENIKEIVQIGGMTNKNYKVVVKDKEYILRIAGIGTEEMIDRHYEMINSKLAADYGLDAEIIYFNEDNGIKISKMIDGAETLNPDTAKSKKILKK
nr:winged helix-turn-helix transcriptional regulator [Caloramator sp. ALD01]